MQKKLTPLMAQYQSIKSEHQEAILFFRMGDFYEMFFDDAKIAAEELKLVLTAREKTSDNPIPMAGIPHHAYRGYAAKLIHKGYKVAICEQVSDPKAGKGIVDRAVTQVLTPGTILEEELLEAGSHNFLAALARDGESTVLLKVDISTGEAFASQTRGRLALDAIGEELLRARPRELLLPKELSHSEKVAEWIEELGLSESSVTSFERVPRPSPKALADFFAGSPPPSVQLDPALGKCLGLVHRYLERTQGGQVQHFRRLEWIELESRMQLDPATVRNLELTETLIERSREGSLLGVLDKTATSMGSRLLRSWLLHPLRDRDELVGRQDAVEALLRSLEARREIRTLLKRVYDIPRCLGRINAGATSPRDLALLRSSLEAFPELYDASSQAGLGGHAEALLGLEDLHQLLEEAVVEDPPSKLDDGGVLRAGYDSELDRLRGLSQNAKDWIDAFAERQRERTGIKSLKVKFNKVFGYFLEVTKANLHLVPDDFERKQTLVNLERYVTEELKAREAEILGAEEKARALESELFQELKERVRDRFRELQAAGLAASRLDVLCTLAQVAEERGYTRPELVESRTFEVQGGRHPVVEALLRDESFVPNELELDPDSGASLVLLTGPNMAGKSTFLRQTALIQLLAQIGSFVPADSARLGLVDRIFTRVGASDDLSRGESTFMVEMREAAFILARATDRSLVILDEIGRGTATFDGLSIAWAMVEHLVRSRVNPKVLFATHYHELTDLESRQEGIRNLSVCVEEQGEDILFLHRVRPGPADKSYGIHVARLAGFPPEVVARAREILEGFEDSEGPREVAPAPSPRALPEPKSPEVEEKPPAVSDPEPAAKGPEAGHAAPGVQLTLFATEEPEALRELRRLDPLRLSPLDALQELVRLKDLLD